MCGRIRQPNELRETRLHGFEGFRISEPEPQLRPNAPPGTLPLVYHQIDGEQLAQGMHWGYRPAWYDRQPVINARLDTILRRSPMWRPTLTRRVIVPVAGWYEWTGEPGSKQPWYIHSRDSQTILLAGVSGWRDGAEPDPAHGMAIITDDSAGGMVDIHARRPVALSPEDALSWLDPAYAPEAALELLSTTRPEGAFAWHQVTRRINSARYQSPDAAEPI